MSEYVRAFSWLCFVQGWDWPAVRGSQCPREGKSKRSMSKVQSVEIFLCPACCNVAMLQCEACAQPMCSQCVAKAKSASVCFQVVLLSCSLLILLCKDHRTAFSYFYEAFEAYHQTSSTAKAWLDTVDTVDTSLSFELFWARELLQHW